MFILKPDEGVLCEAIFIISLVKGLFQWTIYTAQEKISSNWEVIITILSIMAGTACGLNWKLGGTAKKSKCPPKELYKRGIQNFAA